MNPNENRQPGLSLHFSRISSVERLKASTGPISSYAITGIAKKEAIFQTIPIQPVVIFPSQHNYALAKSTF